LIKKIFDPLYVKALKGEDMSPHFERVKINVPTIGSYYIPIYSVFLPSSDHCVEKVNQGKIIYQLTCRNFRKDVTFKFFVEKSKNNALLSLEGKEAPRRPLKIVSDLIQNGTWDEVKKRLSEKQLDTLYSMPSKMKCFDGATSISEFLKNSTYCSDQTYNDHWPDSITYYHSRQLKGSDIVETFSINTRNSDAGRFYLHTSVLARLGTLFKLTNAQAQVNHQEENVNKAKTESAATNSKTTFGAAEAAAHPEQYAEKFKKYHQYQQDSAKGKDVSKVMDLLNLRISLDEKETVTDKNGNKKITKDNQYKYYFILPSTIFDIKKYKIEKEKVLQTISTTDEKLTFKVFPVTGYTKNLKELIDELAKDLSPESIIGLAAKHRVTKDNPYGCTESAKHDFCMVLIKGGKITKKFRVVTVRHYKSQHLMPVVYQIETDDEGLLSLARDLLIVADEFSSLKKVN
jgi:hypothetical protein